jgi:hypothetical protein
LAILGACFIAWILYKSIKHNPQAYSKENFSKSLTTMGLLALGLIAFVYLLIMMVKN